MKLFFFQVEPGTTQLPPPPLSDPPSEDWRSCRRSRQPANLLSSPHFTLLTSCTHAFCLINNIHKTWSFKKSTTKRTLVVNICDFNTAKVWLLKIRLYKHRNKLMEPCFCFSDPFGVQRCCRFNNSILINLWYKMSAYKVLLLLTVFLFSGRDI